MRTRGRTARELGVVAVVLTLVVSIVVAAVQAEGQRTIRPDSNDGGAWLINGTAGVAGHVNRASGEITGVTRLATAGNQLDTEQAPDIVVVSNLTDQTLTVVDPRTFQATNVVDVPAHLQMRLSGSAATLWTKSPLNVWQIGANTLRDIRNLDEVEPVIRSQGDGLVEVTRFGSVLAVDTDASTLHRITPNEATTSIIELGDVAGEAVGISASGDDAAILSASGSVVMVDPDGTAADPILVGDVAALGQPTLPGEPVVAITTSGDIVRAVAVDSEQPSPIATISGQDPLPPLVLNDCIFAVTTQPAALTRTCDGNVEEPQPLAGTSSTSLRLRLVNGWVWVNDLRSGSAWVIDETTPLDRIDDWGAALGNDAEESDEPDNEIDGGQIEQRENPDADDAQLIRADEIDEDGVNEPPVARDDERNTRVELPIIVDVLRNDEDPDGDVILVTELSDVPPDTLINVTGDQRAIQVVPPAGFVGQIRFSYTITDGRGGSDTAVVTVNVLPADASTNRPPVAVTDAVEARAGASVALNVLVNDSDPDGDPILLTGVEAPEGTVTFDGSGQVTFVPDPASTQGSIELAYTVADSYGASTTGTIRVVVRLADSNNEPDARNDAAVTTVGMPLSFNVLLNDTDPDGDPISVAGPPVLLSPDDDTGVEISLTTDGQLFFNAQRPGQYVYSYSIIDGAERDTALIRVDVAEADENRPPVAVRDNVAIARGETSTVFVLANDSDPDGDVVAIENWSQNDYLDIDSYRGAGFIVTVRPEAPSLVTFNYTITDGTADPVPGQVVISTTDTAGVNQPPVVQPDVIEARPGGTTSARVLLNDFDPEGGALRIDRLSSVPDAELRIGQAGQFVLVTLPETATDGFSFSYDVVDEDGNRNAAIVDVRIVPDDGTNRPPIARTDVARTREMTPVTIPVTGNDGDPDGDPIRVEAIVAQPLMGTASITEQGAVLYTPGPNLSGTDRFSYVITDQFGEQAVGEVLVGVFRDTAENRPPTALDDEFTVLVGSDVVALPVTANDYDPDGDALRIIRITQADSVTISDDASQIIFAPPDEIDDDPTEITVTYRVEDGRGGTADAVVTIHVVNSLDQEPPLAVDDTIGPILSGQSVAVSVLDNDIDPDGKREQLTVTSDDGAGRPGDQPGVLVFTAGPETSTHRYTVTDVDGLTASAYVTVLVAENLAPEVTPLTINTEFETPVSLALADQATDGDNDDLFFVCCDSVRGGSAEVTESAANLLNVTFTPDPDFFGQAGFSYTVNDQNGHSVSASVVINVAARENSAPTAQTVTSQIEAGTTGAVALSAGAADVDTAAGDVLSYSFGANQPADSGLSGDTVTITTAIDAAGSTISFDYIVTDRSGETATATAIVEVTESRINPPTAVTDTASTTQGVPVTTDVIANDIDEIGNGLRIVAAGSSAPDGAISYDGGSITFEPSAAFFGTTTINYTIEDGRGTVAGQAVGQFVVDVIGFPAAPPTPQAVADNATATITWGQPAANGAPIEAFELATDGGDVVSLSASSSYTMNGLTNGTPVRFRVRARNSAGWGEWSALSVAVTPDTEPQRPAAPTITFLDEALQVDWTPPANEGSPITGYILEIGGSTEPPKTLGNTTSHSWTNLTNGTTYQFRVTAVNQSGNSDTSAWSAPEHPLREPDASTPVVAERGDKYLDLAWAAPADNGDPVTSYRIEMESQPGVFVPSTTRSYRWANLPNGVTQRFRVQSRNRDADWSEPSSWSDPVKPCGTPLAPTGVNATRGDTTATINWSEASAEGCAITSYTLYAITSAGVALSQTSDGTGTSHTFTGLTNGTSYTFEVRANNSEGAGDLSDQSNAVIPAGPPLRPDTPTVTPQLGMGEITCSIAAPGNNGRPITNWQLSINDGPASAAALSTEPDASTVGCIRSVLAPSTDYRLKARACNEIGCGPWSPNRSFRTWGAPQTPSNFNASPGIGTVTASWNAVDADGPDFYYELKATTAVYPATVTHTTNTSATLSLVSYASYTLSLRACNSLGCSDWANIGPVTSNVATQITLSLGPSADTENGCTSGSCHWIRVSATNLQPYTAYNVACRRSSDESFPTGREITADATGQVYSSKACYLPSPGAAQVRVGTTTSSWFNW